MHSSQDPSTSVHWSSHGNRSPEANSRRLAGLVSLLPPAAQLFPALYGELVKVLLETSADAAATTWEVAAKPLHVGGAGTGFPASLARREPFGAGRGEFVPMLFEADPQTTLPRRNVGTKLADILGTGTVGPAAASSKGQLGTALRREIWQMGL